MKHKKKNYDCFKGDQTVVDDTGFVDKAVIRQITVTLHQIESTIVIFQNTFQ